MTFNASDATAYLLPEYEKRSNEKKLDIAAKIGVSGASYYRMRKGEGNIRSNITEKVLNMVYEKYPELIIESITKRFYEEDPDSFCNVVVRLLPYERLIQLVEQKEKDDEKYELALSGYRGIYE